MVLRHIIKDARFKYLLNAIRYGMSECIKALRTFANALTNYLKVNARRTLAISSLTGQGKVKVALRALARFHNPSLGYPLLSDAITTLISGSSSWLRRLGWGITLGEGEVYLILPLSFIRDYINATEDEIFNYLMKSGVCGEVKEGKTGC